MLREVLSGLRVRIAESWVAYATLGGMRATVGPGKGRILVAICSGSSEVFRATNQLIVIDFIWTAYTSFEVSMATWNRLVTTALIAEISEFLGFFCVQLLL